MVIVIMKLINAEIWTTEIARAFGIVQRPKLLQLAQILADIMISKPSDASTIRLLVHTIAKTASATDIEIPNYRIKLVQVSKVITD